MLKDAIYINDIKFECYDYHEETIQNEPTKNVLCKVALRLELVGNHKKKEFESYIEGIFTFITPQGKKFKAKKENSSWSYNGQVLNMDTPISYYIEIIELDKDLPEEHNFESTLASSVIMNWIRTRAISELLIEKEIITYQEYDDSIKRISERDYANLVNYIVYGIEQKKKKKSE